jgi:GNAT superfamily N-acetyltransferase
MNIRKGRKEDMPAVLSLIQELAAFEKEPDAVVVTVADLERDGFCDTPLFHTFIAEENDQIVGMALYYYRYSTWKGKRLYLEDLIVSETMRGRGLGEKLLDATIEKARETACTGLMWQVLDWNEPAINFYKKFDARFDEGWVNVHIDF